uniref:Uncharacterized protein n=1 Tax=Plectus sambesii TaxID=2011161 RepID=A0A914V660_9BILA
MGGVERERVARDWCKETKKARTAQPISVTEERRRGSKGRRIRPRRQRTDICARRCKRRLCLPPEEEGEESGERGPSIQTPTTRRAHACKRPWRWWRRRAHGAISPPHGPTKVSRARATETAAALRANGGRRDNRRRRLFGRSKAARQLTRRARVSVPSVVDAASLTPSDSVGPQAAQSETMVLPPSRRRASLSASFGYLCLGQRRRCSRPNDYDVGAPGQANR